MQIVSLGFPLPNPQVDNHSLANAPSLFEYDACIIDPRVVSTQIEEIVSGSGAFKSPDGVPLQAGATGAFHYGLGELLQQRHEELVRLLGRGGTVAVMAYPNVPHSRVTTLPGADRYSILPAAPGVVYRAPQLVPGDGRTIQALDPTHPWSVYLNDLRGKLRYRAYWNLDAIPQTEADATVFARSDGGAAVGVEFKVGAGRLVFLPPPGSDMPGKARKPLTDAIVESVQRTLEDRGDEKSPGWLRSFSLPGLSEAQKILRSSQQEFAEAESRLVEAQAHVTDASKYHGLLWSAGHYSFEPLVRGAFRELGFTVSPNLNQAVDIREGNETALVELDASSQTVGEGAYLALQRRVEAEFLRSGVRRKGIVVVNGERMTEPDKRRTPHTDALLNACDNFGYALITGDVLFSLVTYALEGANSDTLEAIRETILETDGLLQVEESDADDTPDDDATDEPAARDEAVGDDIAEPASDNGTDPPTASDPEASDPVSADESVETEAAEAVPSTTDAESGD
ncbi:MAG: hypothetical protein DK306_001524 [Chloroflexi bacterium]|jgi:hypothetical protein|nr:MAG: hypothetical protein DK306_001524 [Chloroflexota bacterium]